jgi:hypothetical protein
MIADFWWNLTCWATAVCIACAVVLAIWDWIEREQEIRRLTKMRREADAKRDESNSGFFGTGEKDAPPYSPRTRAKFLP